MATEVIPAQDLLKALEQALGITNARRIVLDVEYNHYIRVYIEQVGDDRLLKIDWAGELAPTKINIVSKDSP